MGPGVEFTLPRGATTAPCVPTCTPTHMNGVVTRHAPTPIPSAVHTYGGVKPHPRARPLLSQLALATLHLLGKSTMYMHAWSRGALGAMRASYGSVCDPCP